MQTYMLILTGISFAGKSLLAREISQARGWKIIDPDAVAHERGLGLQGEFLSDAQWASVHQEAEQRARNLLRAGESVIYDTTSFVKAERDALRQLALDCGAQPILIYVQISRAEAFRRWETNNQTRERFLVHSDDFKWLPTSSSHRKKMNHTLSTRLEQTQRSGLRQIPRRHSQERMPGKRLVLCSTIVPA